MTGRGGGVGEGLTDGLVLGRVQANGLRTWILRDDSGTSLCYIHVMRRSLDIYLVEDIDYLSLRFYLPSVPSLSNRK